jgi:CubicO group peptidase (beta-lactamase class C family)
LIEDYFHQRIITPLGMPDSFYFVAGTANPRWRRPSLTRLDQ